jgi:predicted metalloprotease with PDZ domain
LIALGSQTSLVSPRVAASPHPRISAQSHARIAYRISVDSADLSGFNVEMRIRGAGEALRLAMAAHSEYDDKYWRYVENLTAESRGVALQIKNEEDALWSVRAPGGDVTVKYRIHLPPQTTPNRSVWKPFLTPTGGLIGDVHSFMYVVGAESAPTRVTLDLPNGWANASGLEPTKDPKTFSASSVELLLDSPIVVGQFQHWDFVVNGLKHDVVYLPQQNAPSFDTTAFIDGIHKLVIEAMTIGGKAPYKRYTFLYQDAAVGALEHINSVTIGARSQSLAQGLTGVFETTAHEYFHTWNLMHVRPTERVGLRYRPAEDTGELWWSEGVTLYFADLMLRRAGLPTSTPTRVAQLERLIAAYHFNPAYARFSAERVSRAAEDPLALGDYSPSTHTQGNLLGTMLDLSIIEATQGRRSLADVMRRLSDRFTPQRGITGRDIELAVREVCACDISSFFEGHVRGVRPIDFDRYLRTIGLHAVVSWSRVLNAEGKPEPDLRVFAFDLPEDPTLRLRISDPNSAWGRAGLHTGDRVVSVDEKPITTSAEFRAWVNKLRIGDTARVEVARDGRVSKVAVVIPGYDRPVVKLEEIAAATPEQKRLRDRWLAAKDR